MLAYRFYQQSADAVVTETFDAAVRSGVVALEYLGVDGQLADEVGEYYIRENEKNTAAKAALFDPKVDPFDNKALQEAYAQELENTRAGVARILRGISVSD